MSLRKKTLLVMLPALGGLIVALWLTSSSIVLEGFGAAEQREARQAAGRLRALVERELEMLAVTVSDWSVWDDTYRYVEDRNEAYRRSNLHPGTLETLGLELFAIVDEDHEIVFARGYDAASGLLAPVPSLLSEQLRPGAPLFDVQEAGGPATGLVLGGMGPVMLAAQPILTSHGEGPMRGVLVMGRRVDDALLKELGSLGRVRVRLYPAGTAPGELRTVARDVASGGTAVRELDEDSIAGYAALRGVDGTPTFLLEAEQSRGVVAQGRESRRLLLIAIAVVAAAFAGLGVVLIERLLLARMRRLREDVREVAEVGDPGARVRVDGGDELADLAARINAMLGSLEIAHDRERTAAERLRGLDEMKNAFLSAVSHELRTPLANILGFALTLTRDDLALPPEQQQEMIDRIASNAQKLERLLVDLLDLDRIVRGVMEPTRRPTDVGALARRVVEETQIGSRPVAVEATDIMADLDGPKVERIIENLLANAGKYTPEGTPVWVRVTQEDKGVTIAVEDAGPGVASEQREAIFEPFHQGDGAPPHAPGTGIGLSLVARFAELHGGRAWVEEREGGGASFRVFLPAFTVLDPSTQAVPDRSS